MRKLITIAMMLGMVANHLDAREITGSVKVGRRGIPAVLVTDGTSFVQTDRKGKFVMEVEDQAKFVSIVLPAGYMADYSSGVPEFYQFLSEKDVYDFKLQKFGNKGQKRCHILAVADPQTQTEENFQEFCGAPLEALVKSSRELAEDAPTIGITLGDICWDEVSHLPRYKEELKKTGIPYFAVIGNHDFNQEKHGMAAAADYEANYGPVNWAAWMGDRFMIALNNIMYKTGRGYDVGYYEETLDWLGQLLSYIPKDTKLIIFQHSPLNLWRDNKWAINSDRLLKMLEGRTVDFITGHRHYQNQLSYGDKIKDHNITSYCGTFWKSPRSADGTPRGFEIFTLEKGRLSWYYQPAGYPADYQMDVCNLGEAAVNKDCVVANIWDADENWKITWYEDGEFMGEMEPTMDATPVTYEEVIKGFGVKSLSEVHWAYHPAPLMHFYKARPSEDAKVVRLRVENPFGKVWEKEMVLKRQEK